MKNLAACLLLMLSVAPEAHSAERCQPNTAQLQELKPGVLAAWSRFQQPGENAIVVSDITIDMKGAVSSASVARSSGNRDIDRAVVTAVRRLRFECGVLREPHALRLAMTLPEWKADVSEAPAPRVHSPSGGRASAGMSSSGRQEPLPERDPETLPAGESLAQLRAKLAQSPTIKLQSQSDRGSIYAADHQIQSDGTIRTEQWVFLHRDGGSIANGVIRERCVLDLVQGNKCLMAARCEDTQEHCALFDRRFEDMLQTGKPKPPR